ncbi:MAG: redox-sensing transcriptional repressor Rex [Phycisphaerae bacterium]
MINVISDKTIGRLSQYRRMLLQLKQQGVKHLFSHQLGDATGLTAAQVRRDLMVIGFTGSPSKGYHVEELCNKITNFLDGHEHQLGAICGIGNLGRAIMGYFPGRKSSVDIVAAFDVDQAKVGRVIVGRRCYHIDEMETICRQMNISVGIITTPADTAQAVAEQLVRGNVKGILNFAPVVLKLPKDVYVQNMDVSMVLEIVAFFSGQKK